MASAEPQLLPETLAGVSAKTQVADIVNAVLDNTAASLDAYHSFLRRNLPEAEVSGEALAKGLDATAARIAPHADACLTRFERFALDTVCAVPSALCDQAELPPLRYSAAEEADLDARLEATRAQLAAAHAATAAMRAERDRLAAELAAGASAAARLRTLAAAAGQENGKDAIAHSVKAVVAMADFMPLLHKAEALCATAPLALAPPQAADGAFARRGGALAAADASLERAAAAAAADAAARRGAAAGAPLAALGAFNARLHGGST